MSKKTRERRRDRDRRKAATVSSDPSVTFWMVSFLDILGYRGVLSGMDRLPLPTEQVGVSEVTRALARAIYLRRRLHAAIPNFLAGASGPMDDFAGLSNEQKRIANEMRAMTIVRSPGPDHYIMAASLQPAPGHFPLRAIYAILTASASAMLVQLALGGEDPSQTLPLRGGIDIAPGSLVMPEAVLYSPAIVRAYELESRTTYPRIAIGDRVPDFLDAVLADGDMSVGMQHSKQLAARVKSMLAKDKDGALILDFYGPVIRESFGEVEPSRTIARRAYEYARTALPVVKARGDAHITEKYEWLLEYMEARRSLWD